MNEKQDDSWECWNSEWNRVITIHGSGFEVAKDHIRDIQALWAKPVHRSWLRHGQVDDARWPNGTSYRRGDVVDPAAGEHAIEAEILNNLGEVTWLGESLADGLNAVPLTVSGGGIEGDLLLLAKRGSAYGIDLTEVKHSSNNAWYAVVENLRQLKLLQRNREEFGDEGICGIFKRRNAQVAANLPIRCVVLGPPEFYEKRGQKGNAVAPARDLIDALGAPVTLAVWHQQTRTAEKL